MSKFLSARLAKMQSVSRKQEGASAVEYGLILGLIVVGIVVLMGTIGDRIVPFFQAIVDALTTAG